jgi:hypothetical protein
MAPKKKMTRAERMALEREAMSGMEKKAEEADNSLRELREKEPCPTCGLLKCCSEELL